VVGGTPFLIADTLHEGRIAILAVQHGASHV